MLKRPDIIRFNEKRQRCGSTCPAKIFYHGFEENPKLDCAPATSVMIKKQAASIPYPGIVGFFLFI